MRKRVGQLVDNWDVNAAYWQYPNNPAEYEGQQPNDQANHNTDDTWTILLVLFTIGFLVLLATTTVWNIL